VTPTPKVVVSASIAYDHIMHFDGSFKDHILEDKAHVISVSFMLGSLKQQRGGVAGNMGYNMALLGVPVGLVGAVGGDFGPYRTVLEDLDIDLSHVVQKDDDFTATAYMNADNHGNQIASFYPGPGAAAQGIDVTDIAGEAEYGIVSAGDPVAMVLHAEQISKVSKLVWDPAFQIVILSGEELSRGLDQAEIAMGNDYEFGMTERKTGLSLDDISRKTPLTVVTYGEKGSEIRAGGECHHIPVAKPRTFADPTGGGDAYRAGIMAGLLLKKDLPVVGRIAALTATHAIEFHGPQEHTYTREDFVRRFDDAFPDFKGALTVDELDSLAS
jgi:adenosine kinase